MIRGEHTTESDELGERLLQVIGAYGMGAPLPARDLQPRNDEGGPPAAAPAHGVRSQDVRPAAGRRRRRTVGA